ncbi:MAG: RNA polymerase subunit sigma-70, partial [Polyangiaceae bacterium]|nr:RNA polymerase subunit sigma-70 [Polyangiaceae bacterium]
LLAAANERVDDVLADAQIEDRVKEKVREFGHALTGKEDIIFRERLVAEEPLTLQELGDRFGVSRERVRQIEKRLLGKLRKYLGDELGEAMLESYEP